MSVIVRMRHIRAANLCAGGARHWFQIHGLSWQVFLENGISVEELDAMNDALADSVSAIARAEAEETDGRE